jgi:hypothetical protein
MPAPPHGATADVGRDAPVQVDVLAKLADGVRGQAGVVPARFGRLSAERLEQARRPGHVCVEFWTIAHDVF